MQKQIMKLIFIPALLLFSQPLWAADELPDCKNPQGSYEESYCAEQEFNETDKELNAVYQQLKKKLNKEQRKLLLDGQKGWLKTRDNDCELEQYGSRGGTGWYTFILGCKNEKTKMRIKELRHLLSAVEGQ